MAGTALIAAIGIGAAGTVAGVATGIDNARSARNSAKDSAIQASKDQQALTDALNKPVPVIPSPDDAAANDARRRSIAQQLARRGRASTILTDSGTGGALGT